MKDLDPIYYHPKGCALVALRQLTDRPDHDIMSAAILNGYDPKQGGMSPRQFRATARQLGIPLSQFHSPRVPLTVGDIVVLSTLSNDAYIVGLADHVCVVQNGRVLDGQNARPDETVDLILWKEDKSCPRK